MPNNWTIENDPPPNNAAGDVLDGLEISQIVGGSGGYSLIDSGGVQLSSTNQTSPPFTFTQVPISGNTWNIQVTKLPATGNGKGKWTQLGNLLKDTGNQDGDFTAQAGTGMGDEHGKPAEPGKAASSGQGY